jgi:hypothetical protein
VHPAVLAHRMGSDNPSGAGNQQERPLEEQQHIGTACGPAADHSCSGILRGHTPAGSVPMTESKIWSEPHGDMGNNSSEIPCRVSSDLHEWRNDFPTVSATDPAKLKYE